MPAWQLTLSFSSLHTIFPISSASSSSPFPSCSCFSSLFSAHLLSSPLFLLSRLLVVVRSRSVWQRQERRENGRKGREKGGSVHNWLFYGVTERERKWVCVRRGKVFFLLSLLCVCKTGDERGSWRDWEKERGDEVYNWADLPLTEIIPPGDRRQREQREGEWW